LTNTIKTRKTTYLGHLMRHEEYSMLQIVLQGKSECKRNVGRKRKSWLQNIKEWTRQNASTLFHMAQDREQFANDRQPQLRWHPGGGGALEMTHSTTAHCSTLSIT